MLRLFRPARAPGWVLAMIQSIARGIAARALEEYRVAELPPADGRKRLVFVADESGGAVIAFNDGSHWRRATDRAIVS